MNATSSITLFLSFNDSNLFIKMCVYFLTGRCGHGSPCEQLCYELHDGMYECDCTEGYELNKNGYSCQGKSFFSEQTNKQK